MVECVVRFVRCQGPVVQRERAAPADDDGVAMVETNADVAADDALAAGGVAAQVAVQGAEPQPVVGELGQLIGHHPVETESVLGEGQPFEGAMGAVDDRGGRSLVDLATLDADQAVLDVVDATDAVRSCQIVQLLHEDYRVEPLAVERDGHAALEADHDLDRLGCRGRVHGPLVDVRSRRRPWILEDAGLDRAAPQVDVDRVDRLLADRYLDIAGLCVFDLLLAREAMPTRIGR